MALNGCGGSFNRELPLIPKGLTVLVGGFELV